MSIRTDLDELFQRPLEEFTAARNALAKSAGKDGAEIKALSKPPLAAWAVNQLYWKDRDRYDALIDAANEMRQTHKAVLEGKRADLRSAGREHELALDAALKATVALLKASGHPVTDAARQAILNTLRALPADEAPGRLTRTLSPGGFEMLAGITPAAGPKRSGKEPAPAKPLRDSDSTAGRGAGDGGKKQTDQKAEREAARAREQRAAAERAVRDADQRARHAEFEAARAAREAAKTSKRLEEARRTLEEAQAELESAERDAERAGEAHEAAERRSQEAQAALEAARAKLLP
jgi:hypothetical protein